MKLIMTILLFVTEYYELLTMTLNHDQLLWTTQLGTVSFSANVAIFTNHQAGSPHLLSLHDRPTQEANLGALWSANPKSKYIILWKTTAFASQSEVILLTLGWIADRCHEDWFCAHSFGDVNEGIPGCDNHHPQLSCAKWMLPQINVPWKMVL